LCEDLRSDRAGPARTVISGLGVAGMLVVVWLDAECAARIREQPVRRLAGRGVWMIVAACSY